MSIKQTVLGLLTPIVANSWAVELPHTPTWPAIVFDIDTTPEPQWVLGGGYDQHAVAVVVLARTLAEIEALLPSLRAALEDHAQSMGVDDEGDADYEGDPEVYGYFINATFRTPRY